MLKRNKLNNKASLKHNEEIEILDFEEENTTPNQIGTYETLKEQYTNTDVFFTTNNL